MEENLHPILSALDWIPIETGIFNGEVSIQ